MRLALGFLIVWIYQNTHKCSTWHQLSHYPEPLRFRCGGQQADTGGISTWPTKTAHQSNLDWITAHRKDNRNCRSCSLGCKSGRFAAYGHKYTNRTTYKLCRKSRQLIVLAVSPTVFNRWRSSRGPSA